ncbi:ParM/StbA family protein [Aliarcobacter butzleri]|uniref:ParM/StbA family protein n=1 Tax=Aliarcobacter butzleri TaxID=28197 RepID=UPI0021B2AB87|nr:ParM/StbA family protein [Aliarcobacter butzleri]UXC30510.1 ParM/StbA family protein [Aliarcobacter butzleri]
MEIAIDIGYGHTKIKTKDSELKFPTAIELVKTQWIETDCYSFEGKKFNVGNDATRNALPTRDYEFLYKYSPLLIVEALKSLGIDEIKDEITIKTGLSLYDISKPAVFEKKYASRGEEFINRISKFYINDKEFNFKIKLFAQGQGVWQDYCLENGVITDGYDVVVDIGYRTNDIVVFKDGKADKAVSSADNKGINQITTDLQVYLNKTYDVNFTEQEVGRILKDKYIDISGARKDLEIVITNIVSSYIEILFDSLKANYGEILKIAKRVIVSGGGAYIIQEYADVLPGNIVFSSNPMEYANVRGYYNG